MSTFRAIAAVTTVLRKLLETAASRAGGGIPVSTLTPSAIAAPAGKRLNLYLYHPELSGAWRNTDDPAKMQRSEAAPPLLGLNLFYLLSAYTDDADLVLTDHSLLGAAMLKLHEHSILGRKEIRRVLAGTPHADSGLAEQFERVRITRQPLSVDEMSKLWTMFQAGYRVSVAYQVAVALIESERPPRTPLPVLTRGENDEGVFVRPNLRPPGPEIDGITIPGGQPSGQLGSELAVHGQNLEDAIRVRFEYSNLGVRQDVTLSAPATEGTVRMQIPNRPADFPCGFCVLKVITKKGAGPERETNALAFPLAPQFRLRAGPPPEIRANVSIVSGQYAVQVFTQTQARPSQQITLLVGDVETRAARLTAPSRKLDFRLSRFNSATAPDGIPPGRYFTRLRIDGVDSLLVADRTAQPPAFDSSQQLTLP